MNGRVAVLREDQGRLTDPVQHASETTDFRVAMQHRLCGCAGHRGQEATIFSFVSETQFARPPGRRVVVRLFAVWIAQRQGELKIERRWRFSERCEPAFDRLCER